MTWAAAVADPAAHSANKPRPFAGVHLVLPEHVGVLVLLSWVGKQFLWLQLCSAAPAGEGMVAAVAWHRLHELAVYRLMHCTGSEFIWFHVWVGCSAAGLKFKANHVVHLQNRQFNDRCPLLYLTSSSLKATTTTTTVLSLLRSSIWCIKTPNATAEMFHLHQRCGLKGTSGVTESRTH